MNSERVNRSTAAKISRTLENALQYVRGTGEWFSARNKTAVISQLIEAQKELDKLNAVVEAARVLLTNDDRDGLQVTISYRALETFKHALAAFDAGEGE